MAKSWYENRMAMAGSAECDGDEREKMQIDGDWSNRGDRNAEASMTRNLDTGISDEMKENEVLVDPGLFEALDETFWLGLAEECGVNDGPYGTISC